jgi:ATP-binding cassette subfamily F protein uup
LEYSGTLLLVSHDRAFLNNLVTSTIVLDGKGGVQEYIGGYDDWQNQLMEEKENLPVQAQEHKDVVPAHRKEKSPTKLSYKEQRALEARQREMDELPAHIEALETEQQQLTAAMADPAFYQRDSGEIASSANRLKELEEELNALYQRWEELEAG